MGWFNRLVARNGTIGLRMMLKRIRFAEEAAEDFARKGYADLAAQWLEKRDRLEREFHDMKQRTDERLESEVRK